jgi:crotonobetainyl-CoA:carnitine CoA-transferase CaiB-like acyl-CoA transferase
MLDSTIATMGWVVSNLLIAGQSPTPMGNANFTAAPSGAFRTGDGLLNIAANKQEQFEALVGAIGRPDLADDVRFSAREARKLNRAELTVEIEQALATRGAAEWEQLLNAVGVPAGRVLSVEDALALDQVRQRGLVHRFDGDGLAVVKTGFKATDAEPELHSPPPRLGEHTDSILASVGFTADEISTFRQEAAI